METRDLPVELTEDELRQRAQRQAAIVQELDDLEVQLRHVKSVHKQRCEALEAELRDVARQVRTGKETREVEIETRKNWSEGSIETYRMDTGEIIESRAMTPTERQRSLEVGKN